MKLRHLSALAALGWLLAPGSLTAEDDPLPLLASLAQDYVKAYNEKDLDAVLAFYTPDAEMLSPEDSILVAGIDAIREVFSNSFSEYPGRRIALDVSSVRQVAPTLVVEEGVARFSDEEGKEEAWMMPYAAFLLRGEDGSWRIASTRELPGDGGEGETGIDPLEGLRGLVGEWILQTDGMQMDLFVYESHTGAYLLGESTITTPAEGEMTTELRIGYDPLANQVRWWTFDEEGGFAGGPWQQVEDRWLVRSSGVTADGESSSALQELTFESDDIIVWRSTHRFLEGVSQPDLELRLVRRPPPPAVFSDGDGDAPPPEKPSQQDPKEEDEAAAPSGSEEPNPQ